MNRTLILVGLATFFAFGAHAQPGRRRARFPLPAGARSAEVIRTGATVRSEPRRSAERRGTVRVGTRLAVLARVDGPGCPSRIWVQTGPAAFICESLVRWSPQAPGGEDLTARGVNRTHAFVRTDGAWAYRRPSDYFRDDWVESLGRGFGVVVLEQRDYRGLEFARTMAGYWILVSDLRFARPSDFAGVHLSSGERPESYAWVRSPHAHFHRRPAGPRTGPAERLSVVRVHAEQSGWIRGEGQGWIRAAQLARPRPATPPTELRPGSRWIDVDTQTQTLSAWVGDRPVFATAVSTGRAATRTPRGVHRVWVKLIEDDMDDLERTDRSRNYAIRAVPWVQYFQGSVALHATFWHDRFGYRRSHGCVNLSVSDARYLFQFTQPALPRGWDAVLPAMRSTSTIVRVR